MDRQILMITVPAIITNTVKQYFALEKLNIVTCDNAGDVLRIMAKERFCLIIFHASALNSDEMQSAVSRLRGMTFSPMLVFTSMDKAAAAMEVGADICIPIESDIHVIFAQAMAMIRRYKVYDRYDQSAPVEVTLYRGDLMIDSARHRVLQGDAEVPLLPREFRLLAYFARNPGLVLTPEQISRAIWLDSYHSAKDAAKVVSELRRKLHDRKDIPIYIETVRGVGYRFLPG